MVILRRYFRVLLPCGLALLGVQLALIITSPVQADVGLQPVLPGGSNIEPEGQTPIQMSAELVTMKVRSATAADNTIIQLNPQTYGIQYQPVWYSAVAEVTAEFTMTNPTSDSVSLAVWFPLASALESVSWQLNPDESAPYIANFHVAVDGKSLDYSVIELPNPKGSDKPQLPWASFPVTFPAEKDTRIQVRYLLPLAQAIKGNALALYYVFQTGAGWAGPIGQAELVLNLPYPASDGTLVRILPGNLGIPYAMAYPEVTIPSGGVMKGNQACWAWTNFEPTSQDDFAVWLMDPALWKQLEGDQAAVQADSSNGLAWLKLASLYRTLATSGYNSPSIFNTTYLPLSLEAFQKAADLLPDHPVPHDGLALVTLAQYVTSGYIPAEAMQFIQAQLATAKDLEAKHPELANEAGLSSLLVDDSLLTYFGNVTATANFVANSTSQARESETAAFLLTPSVTPTSPSTHTPTVFPSSTPEPIPSTTATPAPVQPGNALGTSEAVIIILLVVLFVLLIVASMLLKRARDKAT
jgi:hypothetical protein